MGGRTRSGTTNSHGTGGRDRDLGSLGGLGEKFCSICRGGGYESLHAISPTNLLAMFGGSHETVNFCRHLRAMPPAKSSRRGIFGASLVAATLIRRTVNSTDSSPSSLIGASLVATTLHIRAMPAAKSSIFDLTGASHMATTLHLRVRAMPDAKSSIFDMTGASLVAATLHLRAMPDAKSSILDLTGASLVAATLHIRAMPPAKSSILELTGACLMAATLHLRAMPDAKSSMLDMTGASLVTATLHPPAMSGTNSSPNGQFGASLAAAKFTHVFVIMVMSITMMWICVDEKNSLDIDKGGVIVVGRWQSKTMRRSLLPLEVLKEDEWILFWSWCSRAKKRNSKNSLRLGKRVAHANKNFWSVYLARHTNYSKLVYLRVTHLTFSFQYAQYLERGGNLGFS